MINREAVRAAYEKLSRRKGKPVAATDLHSGDLVRRKNARQDIFSLQRVIQGHDGTFRLEWAHESLYAHQFFRHSGRPIDCFEENAFCRVATQDEYPLPVYETDLNTVVYFNPNDTVCCQNIIYGREGQHFTMSREEYEIKRESEKAPRNWLEGESVCEKCFGKQ